MDFLENISEETILIIPYQIKEKILKKIDSMNKLVNVKLFSLEELKSLLLFDYDVKSIIYLMTKYDYKYEVAKNYIENMYFVTDKKYDNDKLDNLLSLKKELEKEGLLEFDKMFLDYIKDKNALVFGYDYIDNFYSNILSNFKKVDYIKKEENNLKKKVYKFNNIEDETSFVIEEIIKLKKEKVSLTDIYLVNVSDEYNEQLIKLFEMYNVPIELDNVSNISTIPFFSDALSFLKEETSFARAIELLLEKYDLKNEYVLKLYHILVNIFNKYNTLDFPFSKVMEAVEYEFKNTKVPSLRLVERVRVTSLKDNYFSSDEYVFLLGANEGSFPPTYKDEDFIGDDIKDLVNLDTTDVKNMMEAKSVITAIKSIKNLSISYKLYNGEDEYFKANILENEIFEECEYLEDVTNTHSLLHSKIKLTEMLDDLIKYDIKNPKLPLYYANFDIPYSIYDNKFTGINDSKLKKLIGEKLVLSYSNINNFYKCNFRFYLDNILKVNKFEDNFNTLVGSLFHYVLSKIYNKNFDMEYEYNSYLKDKTFTKKEEFFLNKLKGELRIICDYLKEFNADTGLSSVFTEKNIEVDKSSEIKVIFKGIVDKIMYQKYDGKTLVALVDYKTGSSDFDLCNSVYGIGMQLIIYLYLISKSGLFSDYNFVGFYLQKILNSEVNIEKDKTYIDLKRDNLKLYGYSIDDTYLLEKFDTTYENSKYIMSMKHGKNGFYRYSKVLNEEEINSLIDLVDEKINFARDSILSGDFKINPKHIETDKDVTGCKYCNYRDICYHKNEDIVNLAKYNDLSFLKSEEVK